MSAYLLCVLPGFLLRISLRLTQGDGVFFPKNTMSHMKWSASGRLIRCTVPHSFPFVHDWNFVVCSFFLVNLLLLRIFCEDLSHAYSNGLVNVGLQRPEHTPGDTQKCINRAYFPLKSVEKLFQHQSIWRVLFFNSQSIIIVATERIVPSPSLNMHLWISREMQPISDLIPPANLQPGAESINEKKIHVNTIALS